MRKMYLETRTSNYRSSHWRCSVKKGVLRNFAKFTEKHMCQRLFFNKVAGLRPANLLKKSLWHKCFPVNFAKFLRSPFFQNTSGRLLLQLTIMCSINRDLNRGFLVYIFSLRFLGSKFLIHFRRRFRVRKIFRTQVFVGFAILSFCV